MSREVLMVEERSSNCGYGWSILICLGSDGGRRKRVACVRFGRWRFNGKKV